MSMRTFHTNTAVGTISDLEKSGIQEFVKKELKANTYDEESNTAKLTDSQVFATGEIENFYLSMFTDPEFKEAFKPIGYLSNETEIRQLSKFFYWGAWVCSVERPGEKYSYTHNWPFDPEAGNTPTASTLVWSLIGLLALILSLGAVMYYYGQFEQLKNPW